MILWLLLEFLLPTILCEVKFCMQAKVLFSVFLDRMGISMRNGWFDEKNRVFIIYQISEIQEDLGFSKRKAMDYLAEL